jgi:15-hydroxyprostaglandin dehydrogenase (NAD)
MGLALTHHLLSSETIQWRVVLADINDQSYEKISSTLDQSRTIFQRTDVSSWEDSASLFKRAFEWSSDDGTDGKGKIDFFAANAGIDDKESVYAPFDLEAEPAKPNVKTLEVDLLAVFFGLKLFIHYARKTRSHLAPSTSFTPGMVITASNVGLYKFHISPQYCAAKYGLIGLTRSVGQRLLAEENMSVNAVLPGLVATGMPPPWMVAQVPPGYMTPMSRILEAYDEFMKEEIVDGKMKRKTGLCAEAAEDKLHYREPVDYPSEGQRWLFEDMLKGGPKVNGDVPKPG